MRMVIVGLGTAAVTAALVYVLMRGDSIEHRRLARPAQAVRTTDTGVKDQWIGALMRAQATDKTAAENEMADRIAELEKKTRKGRILT